MYIALVEMTLLICALLALLWHICRQGRFTFLVWLICLLIASDIGAILLSIGSHFEGSPAHANHTTPLSLLTWGSPPFCSTRGPSACSGSSPSNNGSSPKRCQS